MSATLKEELLSKINQRKLSVGVIGQGYVGLPLAIHIAQAGFSTTGFDVSPERVQSLNQGQSHIYDVDSKTLAQLLEHKSYRASADFSQLKECDLICVCVPTLLDSQKNPDMTYLVQAVETLQKHLRKGQAVILESTTYPGTTEEILLPRFKSTGLKLDEEFILAYSPERIDPGNTRFTLKNTPKIVGGISPISTKVAAAFYQTFVDKVVPVSSSRAAELVKLVENTFRIINISFANELALACDRLKLNTWEVIEAAATKPFGFMSFYPGPGIGGDCIPVTPHYLRWKLEQIGHPMPFIDLADQINQEMPLFVADKTVGALKNEGKNIQSSKILLLGIAFKRDINDARLSPALDIFRLLKEKGASVSYHDPYIPHIQMGQQTVHSVALEQNLKKYDAVLLTTQHTVFKLPELVENSNLFIDTRNATQGMAYDPKQLIRLFS